MPDAMRQDVDLLVVNNHRHYFKAYSRHFTNEGWRKVYQALKSGSGGTGGAGGGHKQQSSKRGRKPRQQQQQQKNDTVTTKEEPVKVPKTWDPIVVKPGDVVHCSLPAVPHVRHSLSNFYAACVYVISNNIYMCFVHPEIHHEAAIAVLGCGFNLAHW
jgi:hypothetical protein